ILPLLRPHKRSAPHDVGPNPLPRLEGDHCDFRPPEIQTRCCGPRYSRPRLASVAMQRFVAPFHRSFRHIELRSPASPAAAAPAPRAATVAKAWPPNLRGG